MNNRSLFRTFLLLSSLAISFALVFSLPLNRVWSLNFVENDRAKKNSLVKLQKIAQQTTVRILTSKAAGSGVIIAKTDDIYTVVTNWHVVNYEMPLTIMTADAQKHQVLDLPQQLGSKDLAIVKFQSTDTYKVTKISQKLPKVGELVYASGFPLYYPQSLETTLQLGIKAFNFTQGRVSIILPKSLPEGYLLGYTNKIEIGMSGGPIFNQEGLLVGINGRTKDREFGFGVYTFEDGSEPSPAILELMANSSLGIPITTDLDLVPNSTVENSTVENELKPINPLPDM